MADLERWLAELQSPVLAKRAEAAESLCTLGPDAQPAAVGLVRAAADEDETVSAWVNEALENLGSPPVEAQPELVALLKHESSTVNYWAATLLGRLGPAASESQYALAELLNSSASLAARERAAWALKKVEGSSDEAIAALNNAASQDQPRLSRLAQEALAALAG